MCFEDLTEPWKCINLFPFSCFCSSIPNRIYDKALQENHLRETGQEPFSLKKVCELEGKPPGPFFFNDVWGFQHSVICLENPVLAVWAINSLVTLTFQTSPKCALTVNQHIIKFKAKSLIFFFFVPIYCKAFQDSVASVLLLANFNLFHRVIKQKAVIICN